MNPSSSGWIIAAAAAAAIFVLDVFIPLGIAVPMWYVIPILLTWLVPGSRITVVLACCSLLLTVLGIVLSIGEFTSAVAADRALASTLELVIALLVIRQKQSAAQVTDAQRVRDISEERLRLAMEGADLGSWDVNVRTGEAIWNRRHAFLQGYASVSGPVSMQAWKDRVHPDDLDRVVAQIEQAKSDRGLFSTEHRVVYGDGREARWLSLYGRFSYDETGEPVRFSGVSLDITERKRAEAALHTVEARQRVLLKSTPAMIYSCKVTGDFGATFVSENVVDQLGYRPKDFTDDPHFWVNHIHPDDRSRVLADLSTIFETNQHVHEYRFLRKDGTYCWLHDELRVIRNEDGVPQELIGYQIDITARKEAEGQLRQGEERLNQAIHVAKLGIFDHDHQTGTLYWSPMMREIYGVPADEPASLDGYIQLIHPEDRDATVAAVRRAHDPSGDGLYVVEHRLLRRDGTVRWVSFRSRTFFEGDGPARKPVRTMGAMIDMTERKQAEEALKESEALLRDQAGVLEMFIAHAPAALAMFDRDMRYLYASRRWRSEYGLGETPLQGRSHYEVFPDLPECWKEAHRKGLAGEVIRSDADSYERSDGTVQWSRWELRPWFNRVGAIGGIVIFSEDITERKQAEETLHQNQRELQQSEAQLQDLTAKLFAAQDHERQRIARDLHDDFSQRLAAIVLDLAALERRPPVFPELIPTAIKPICEEVERLAHDLHSLAYQLHPSVLTHLGLQLAIEDFINKAIERTGLCISVKVKDFPQSIPLEWSTCLFRVFQESLQNIVKHAKATEVLVRLSGSSKGIGLSVIDDGQGFDARDKSSHQKGLGLTSMQERLRLLNGFLNIHSRPADGTKVCAWIPFREKTS